MVNAVRELMLLAPQSLALAYAPREIRDPFRWLLLFDQRLSEVLERAREPMIAQMRLAWWRDMLAKPDGERPKGEPLLASLTDQNESFVALAAAMVDGYEAMIDAPEQSRLPALFAAYGALIGASADELATIETLAKSVRVKSSRKLRPLSILALVEQLERSGGRASGLRLSWHALTGR